MLIMNLKSATTYLVDPMRFVRPFAIAIFGRIRASQLLHTRMNWQTEVHFQIYLDTLCIHNPVVPRGIEAVYLYRHIYMKEIEWLIFIAHPSKWVSFIRSNKKIKLVTFPFRCICWVRGPKEINWMFFKYGRQTVKSFWNHKFSFMVSDSERENARVSLMQRGWLQKFPISSSQWKLSGARTSMIS